MKRRILLGVLAVLVSFGINVSAQTYQSHIEHPIVRYQISARYDPATKKIAGHYNLLGGTTPRIPFRTSISTCISMPSRTWIARSCGKSSSAGGAIC